MPDFELLVAESNLQKDNNLLQKDPPKAVATTGLPAKASPTKANACFTLQTPMSSTPSSPSHSSKGDEASMLSVNGEIVRALNDEGAFKNDEETSIASSQAELVGFGPDRGEGKQSMMGRHLRVIKTVKEAWLYPDMIQNIQVDFDESKVYTGVMPRLNCSQCCGDQLMTCYDETYKNWHVNDNMWFEKTFINQFGQLLQHIAHGAASASAQPQFFACTFPVHDNLWEEQTQKIVPQTTVVSDVLVSVAGDGSHYAVMEFVFSSRICTVYDGFASSTHVQKWVRYAKFLLQSIGYLPITAIGESCTYASIVISLP